MLPFTPEQFLLVFVKHNNAIWPIQIAAYLLGGISVALLFRKTPEADRVIAGIFRGDVAMDRFWLSRASFSMINKAAYLFAVLFIIDFHVRNASTDDEPEALYRTLADMAAAGEIERLKAKIRLIKPLV
jgi:hypothetical protein